MGVPGESTVGWASPESTLCRCTAVHANGMRYSPRRAQSYSTFCWAFCLFYNKRCAVLAEACAVVLHVLLGLLLVLQQTACGTCRGVRSRTPRSAGPSACSTTNGMRYSPRRAQSYSTFCWAFCLFYNKRHAVLAEACAVVLHVQLGLLLVLQQTACGTRRGMRSRTPRSAGPSACSTTNGMRYSPRRAQSYSTFCWAFCLFYNKQLTFLQRLQYTQFCGDGIGAETTRK